jgi:hypothetical protein
MKKLDLKKQYKELHNPGAKKVAVVKVPRLNFIMVDGTIPPNIPVGDAPDYQKRVGNFVRSILHAQIHAQGAWQTSRALSERPAPHRAGEIKTVLRHPVKK